MSRILLNISEFFTSFFTCAIVSAEILRESINYLILSVLILVIRWISAKVEKLIVKQKKDKKNDTSIK